MNNLFDFFKTNPIYFILLLLALWLIFLQYQNSRTKSKFKVLFKGSKTSDLEGVIFEHIRRLRKTEKDIKNLEKFDKYLEKMAKKGIQKIGIIRFNPFKDVGGDHSFSIALLDSENNGFVITNLFTRGTSRIYTKPIEVGKSKYQLSEEEQKAIKMAKGGIKI